MEKNMNWYMMEHYSMQERWFKMRKYFCLEEKETQEIPHKKGYIAKLVEDKINGIGFYVLEKTQQTIEKEKLQEQTKSTDEKMVECFEYFLNKLMNCKTATDLLKIFDYNDFPHDLKSLMKERNEARKKIKELESEE